MADRSKFKSPGMSVKSRMEMFENLKSKSGTGEKDSSSSKLPFMSKRNSLTGGVPPREPVQPEPTPRRNRFSMQALGQVVKDRDFAKLDSSVKDIIGSISKKPNGKSSDSPSESASSTPVPPPRSSRRFSRSSVNSNLEEDAISNGGNISQETVILPNSQKEPLELIQEDHDNQGNDNSEIIQSPTAINFVQPTMLDFGEPNEDEEKTIEQIVTESIDGSNDKNAISDIDSDKNQELKSEVELSFSEIKNEDLEKIAKENGEPLKDTELSLSDTKTENLDKGVAKLNETIKNEVSNTIEIEDKSEINENKEDSDDEFIEESLVDTDNINEDINESVETNEKLNSKLEDSSLISEKDVTDLLDQEAKDKGDAQKFVAAGPIGWSESSDKINGEESSAPKSEIVSSEVEDQQAAEVKLHEATRDLTTEKEEVKSSQDPLKLITKGLVPDHHELMMDSPMEMQPPVKATYSFDTEDEDENENNIFESKSSAEMLSNYLNTEPNEGEISILDINEEESTGPIFEISSSLTRNMVISDSEEEEDEEYVTNMSSPVYDKLDFDEGASDYQNLNQNMHTPSYTPDNDEAYAGGLYSSSRQTVDSKSDFETGSAADADIELDLTSNRSVSSLDGHFKGDIPDQVSRASFSLHNPSPYVDQSMGDSNFDINLPTPGIDLNSHIQIGEGISELPSIQYENTTPFPIQASSASQNQYDTDGELEGDLTKNLDEINHISQIETTNNLSEVEKFDDKWLEADEEYDAEEDTENVINEFSTKTEPLAHEDSAVKSKEVADKDNNLTEDGESTEDVTATINVSNITLPNATSPRPSSEVVEAASVKLPNSEIFEDEIASECQEKEANNFTESDDKTEKAIESTDQDTQTENSVIEDVSQQSAEATKERSKSIETDAKEFVDAETEAEVNNELGDEYKEVLSQSGLHVDTQSELQDQTTEYFGDESELPAEFSKSELLSLASDSSYVPESDHETTQDWTKTQPASFMQRYFANEDSEDPSAMSTERTLDLSYYKDDDMDMVTPRPSTILKDEITSIPIPPTTSIEDDEDYDEEVEEIAKKLAKDHFANNDSQLDNLNKSKLGELSNTQIQNDEDEDIEELVDVAKSIEQEDDAELVTSNEEFVDAHATIEDTESKELDSLKELEEKTQDEHILTRSIDQIEDGIASSKTIDSELSELRDSSTHGTLATETELAKGEVTCHSDITESSPMQPPELLHYPDHVEDDHTDIDSLKDIDLTNGLDNVDIEEEPKLHQAQPKDYFNLKTSRLAESESIMSGTTGGDTDTPAFLTPPEFVSTDVESQKGGITTTNTESEAQKEEESVQVAEAESQEEEGNIKASVSESQQENDDTQAVEVNSRKVEESSIISEVEVVEYKLKSPQVNDLQTESNAEVAVVENDANDKSSEFLTASRQLSHYPSSIQNEGSDIDSQDNKDSYYKFNEDSMDNDTNQFHYPSPIKSSDSVNNDIHYAPSTDSRELFAYPTVGDDYNTDTDSYKHQNSFVKDSNELEDAKIKPSPLTILTQSINLSKEGLSDVSLGTPKSASTITANDVPLNPIANRSVRRSIGADSFMIMNEPEFEEEDEELDEVNEHFPLKKQSSGLLPSPPSLVQESVSRHTSQRSASESEASIAASEDKKSRTVLDKVQSLYNMFQSKAETVVLSTGLTQSLSERTSPTKYFTPTKRRGMSDSLHRTPSTIQHQVGKSVDSYKSLPTDNDSSSKKILDTPMVVEPPQAQQDSNTRELPPPVPKTPVHIKRMSLLDPKPYSRSESLMSVDDDQEDQDIDWDFWGKLVNDYESMNKKNRQIVEQNLIQGIPVSLRGTLWQLMSKSQSVDMENVYADLLKRTSPYEKLISQDLSRTYPSLTYFRREGGHGQESLFNVVKCYSLYDPEVGYCQGLPFIVGPLLLNMPDEEAFCMLTKLMAEWDLRQHFVPNMIGLQIRTYQFERLMEMFFPNISIHLERQGVQSSMYASQWFMTLFGYRSSMKIVFRVIDMLLFEGTNVLFKLALTLLKLGEAKILSLEFEQLLNYLKIDIFQIFQEQTSLVISESRQFQIPDRKLKQWAKEYTAELKRLTEEEKLVNTLSANNQQLEERVKSLDTKVQDLTNGQLEMANDYVQVQTELANQKQLNRNLQAKIEELEARLLTERQSAEESLKDHLEQLAQKNLSLVTKNMELEDQLHSTEQLLMGARNKIANYETGGGAHSASSSVSALTDSKSVNSVSDQPPTTTKKWGGFRSILS